MNFRLDENGTKLAVREADGGSIAWDDVQPNVAPYEFIGNIVEEYANGKLAAYMIVRGVVIDEDDSTIFLIQFGSNDTKYVDNTAGKFYDSKEALLAAREAAAAEEEGESEDSGGLPPV